MKRIIAKVICNGEYQVIYDDTQKVNPYRVYYKWCEVCGECGVKHRKKQLQRYQDLGSAMYYLADRVRRYQ
jgi:hypothetical protein